MAKAPEEKVSFITRLKQIGMVFQFTAKQDKKFVPLVIVAVLIPIAISVGLWFVWGWLVIPLGIMLTLLAVLIVLNLRSNTAMMASMEGQPGAAIHLISNMRGNWRANPEKPLAATTQMDVVHLVIGKPGVILIGEGNPQRVKQMITEQKRRLGKVVGDAPLYDYIIGNDEGQLPLRKLRSTLIRMPNNISGKEINNLDRALTALTARPQMPKGQLPKEFRPPKGATRQMRGR
ncbi:DUF4191 domain-containing protein [Catelliglobosispora koreensis]|uniref:DUF4191 domain-containing protein n=1 Tax=Catelliglobosispora koreensis TaxID=129052 RepID=UPI000363DD37|nr:DUF4191 domain-containing protein [Catelliglobosispora koreensis]